ncbi:hypothetical protein HY571_00285, partial [Candidatus Micrarchaeota archaeon]|nr:hypothetical protein [Candidatus Micrarchaeota archaeon]
MKVDVVITDGSEPVLYSIGPALEAREVLKTLKGEEGLLSEKSCIMAGMILSMVREISKEEGYKIARHQLQNGNAYQKFRELIEAQGGNPNIQEKSIKIGRETTSIKAQADGKVEHIDNRAISRVCRALGSPAVKSAGMVIHVRVGQEVKKGGNLFTLFAENREKLRFAVDQSKQFPVVEIERIVIESL